MFISSSSTTFLHHCCYVLMIVFITSTYTYVIDTDSLNDQQIGFNSPLYYENRLVRTTKFPRIGRSLADFEDVSYPNIDETEENPTDNEYRWLEQRSVLFPRIGKRAFHNILLASSLSNPHRVLDGQGRYHINGYDYHIHRNNPQIPTQHRVQ